MKLKEKRGFTLIELLVVIAIIGLLAAIVLAAVGSARNKGVDASVKGQLNNARAQAELYASNNGNSYTGVCTASQATNGLLAIVNNAASSTGAVVGAANAAVADGVHAGCDAAATTWAVEAPLKASIAGTPVMWCVDSSGQAEQTATLLGANATNCP